MKITIDPHSADHPYVQLADQLRDGIRRGEIGPLVPSLHELCAQTGLSLNTVRRAVQMLAAEGLVYGVPGRGTFVRGPAGSG